MSRHVHTGWLLLSPPFPESGEARLVFRDHAERIAGITEDGDDDSDVLQQALNNSLVRAKTVERPAALRAALNVLTDLARQRWFIRVTDEGGVEVKRPSADLVDSRREKTRIRAQELIRRDEQLREPATQNFVRGMEKTTLRRGRPVSIFSLVRDGRELEESLRRVRALPLQQRASGLLGVVEPYLQFVEETAICEYTGLRLQDIWRYFRHTWSNQYTSTPGRSMAILVRDRAREFHPIIGIAALGSPIVQIRERDAWIGWHPDAFLEFATEAPSVELGVWLIKIVDGAISEIFVDDFVEEQLIDRRDLRQPSLEVVARLSTYSKAQRELHHRFARSQDLKRSSSPNDADKGSHWGERAQTHLYRSKRALSLSEMLHSRQVLSKYIGMRPSADAVRGLLETTEGRRTVKKVLRKAKADRVGIAMADLTVCGAVAPYNQILGGKLVSMLAASAEVIVAYRDKYVDQESEIASSMAGRPIVRPSQLVFLGTTSLYGVGSSQYNRLRMPAETLGGRSGERLAYLAIGKSEAYGTSHFSTDTVEALVALVQQSSNGQRVNSIFGEGVSPKLRKMRDGLGELKLPVDALLQHGRQRIVYGVPLVRNLREFLLGMDDEPEYLFDLTAPEQSTIAIVRWWIERWLSNRIMSDDILSRLEQHTLVRPIRHGARVVLPSVDDAQGFLFDDFAS